MRTILVPGFRGSLAGHWQYHWAESENGAVLLDQDNFERPDLGSWLSRLDRAVKDNPGALLVGHSLGAVLVAHYASAQPRADIAGALLVAPADVDRSLADHPEFISFAGLPRLRVPFPAIVVGSRNDPWMAFDRAEYFAGVWDADFVDMGLAGHINIDSGYGPWPAGQRLGALIADHSRSIRANEPQVTEPQVTEPKTKQKAAAPLLENVA